MVMIKKEILRETERAYLTDQEESPIFASLVKEGFQAKLALILFLGGSVMMKKPLCHLFNAMIFAGMLLGLMNPTYGLNANLFVSGRKLSIFQ